MFAIRLPLAYSLIQATYSNSDGVELSVNTPSELQPPVAPLYSSCAKWLVRE